MPVLGLVGSWVCRLQVIRVTVLMVEWISNSLCQLEVTICWHSHIISNDVSLFRYSSPRVSQQNPSCSTSWLSAGVLSSYGTLDYRSRQNTVYIEPAQFWKEPFANDLLAFSKANKSFYDICYPSVFAERHIEGVFDKVYLWKEQVWVEESLWNTSGKLAKTHFPTLHWRRKSGPSESPALSNSRVRTLGLIRSLQRKKLLEAVPALFVVTLASLNSLGLDDVNLTGDIMRVLSHMPEYKALSVRLERLVSREDCLPPTGCPKLPLLRSLCLTTNIPDLSFLANLACDNLQELRLLSSIRTTNVDSVSASSLHFPRLRSIAMEHITSFSCSKHSPSLLNKLVYTIRVRWRNSNIVSCRDPRLNLSWIRFIKNVLCGNVAEEWEGMGVV